MEDTEKAKSDVLRALLGVPTNNASINVSAGGGIAIAVACIGVLAIVIAIAAVRESLIREELRAERVEDLRKENAELRGEIRTLRAYRDAHEKRLNNLERGDG